MHHTQRFAGVMHAHVFAALRQCCWLCLFFVAASFCFQASAQQQELESIQALIKQTKAQLDKKLKSSERLQQELKLAELEIAQTATQLNKTDRALVQTKTEKAEIETRISGIQNDIKQQQNLLAGQLKSAYMAGNYDFAKMFFNQQDAGRFERVLTYYQYMNAARQQQISAFKLSVEQLKQAEIALQSKTEELVTLQSTQAQQAKLLGSQQQQRYKKLQALDQQIQTDTAKVEALEQEENNLLNAIEQAEIDARQREQAGDIELVGLGAQKGQLRAPTTGKLQSLFGKRRQGQVRWKGVIFNTPEGTAVKAVSEGKVLYADWLKGFGLVVIVDHGKGYMSVYGRNQALLKQAGDTVQSGETISLVGSSGGQTSASLYFEIRHKGKALNPSQWLSR